MSLVNKKMRAKRYHCNNCNKDFYKYILSDFQYGEKFLYTLALKKQVYFNCFDNEEFINDVRNVISALLPSISKTERSKIFDLVVGYCCDEVNGDILVSQMEKGVCQCCGSREIILDENYDEIIEEKIPYVTHRGWDSLSYSDKKELIKNVLKGENLL